MTRWIRLTCLSLLAAALMFGEQWVGWITDEKCATAGNYAGDVHKKCVAEGLPIVFVNEADRKIYKIENPNMVKEVVGQKVTLTGTAKGDAIKAEKVAQTTD